MEMMAWKKLAKEAEADLLKLKEAEHKLKAKCKAKFQLKR